MIKKFKSAVAVLTALALVFSLAACSGGVYSCDDAKKSYDKKYEPAAKVPLALTEDEITTIKSAAAGVWNSNEQIAYDYEMDKYNEAVIADALAAAADSSAAAAASKSGSSYESAYTPANLTEPTAPDYKDAGDISFYTYGGTFNGYIAVKYKVKGKAVVAAHQVGNLSEDIIGNYNFSYYPDSPVMSLFKDGVFYTVREIFESGGITETDLKNIWYNFYVEN